MRAFLLRLAFVLIAASPPPEPGFRARAVTPGGDPASPHFNDQAGRYASSALREVYFHPEQLHGHVERVYRPGQ